MIASHSDLPSSEFTMHTEKNGDRCLAYNVVSFLPCLLSHEGDDNMSLFLSSYTIKFVPKIIQIISLK